MDECKKSTDEKVDEKLMMISSLSEDEYTAFGRNLNKSSNEFESHSIGQRKQTRELVFPDRKFFDKCIWMVGSIRSILTGYRAEIKGFESAARLGDCIEILSNILATLQGIKAEMYDPTIASYADCRILGEILAQLQDYRHEILCYWREISHEDCVEILNDIRDLLRELETEIKERRSKVIPEEQYGKPRKMMHKISKGERIEELRRKLDCLTTQRNLLIRTERETEKEEEEFNAFKVAEEWEEKRSQVLRRIVEIEEKIKSLSKWMSIFKITIYSTGVLYTVTNYFCFTVSQNRNSTLTPLLLIGSIGLGTLLAEKLANDRFKDLFELLAEDQMLLAQILQQYNNTNEFESGIEDVFPFHITKNIVQGFSRNTKCYSMSVLLDILLEKRKYSGPDNEKTKIHNLAFHPSFPWNWLFSEKSKDVFIIIAKIKLIYHNVQTENPASEDLYAIFWGSLFLDGLSIIKEFDRLRSFECRKVCLMGMLKNHLTCEMLALKKIVKKP